MEKNTILKIENLHVNINDREILKGLNLEIKPGEIHALMGTNGAGKSTLVKTLSAHYDCIVTEGKIEGILSPSDNDADFGLMMSGDYHKIHGKEVG